MYSTVNCNDRMMYLDGLRGVAAVSVVAYHLACAFLPNLTVEYGAHPLLIVWTPLAVLWNGHFAVLIFFTLSGMILTEAVHRRAQPLWSRFALRYLRLAVPAAFSVLVAWGLLSLFPSAATDVRTMTGSDWLSYTYQHDLPDLPEALHDGFVSVFLQGGSFFNNALWTMRPELLGSALCFIVAVLRGARARVVVALAFGVLAVSAERSEYLCFALGILLAEARAAERLRPTFPALVLTVGLLVGSRAGTGEAPFGGLLAEGAGYEAVYPIAAAAVIYSCMTCRPVQTMFLGPVPQFLGVVSVPLYLLHVPLIMTVLAQAYLITHSNLSVLVIVFAILLIGLFAISYLAAKFVERPLLIGLGWLRDRPGSARRTAVIRRMDS